MIENLRSEIDQIDDEIVRLLHHRLVLASQIGKIKSQIQQEIKDPQREEAIIQRLESKGLLSKKQIQLIYQNIFLLTQQIQEESHAISFH